MSGISILMMIVALVIIWGGMILAAIHLWRNPDETSGTLAELEDPTAIDAAQ